MIDYFVTTGLMVQYSLKGIKQTFIYTGKHLISLGNDIAVNSITVSSGNVIAKATGKKVVKSNMQEAFDRLAKTLSKQRLQHITDGHAFGTLRRAFKFNKDSNIEEMVKEGISKPGRYGVAESIDYLNNDKIVRSVIKEVEMGRVIGKASDGRDCTILRIIVSLEEGQGVLTAYGVRKFSVN